MSAQVIINGKSYQGGSSVQVNKDGTVIIDGRKVDNGTPNSQGVLEVHVVGDAINVRSNSAITVNGNVMGNVNSDGSVSCNDVGGNIIADGSVNAHTVKGKITADGSVNVQHSMDARNTCGAIQAGNIGSMSMKFS